MNIRIVGAGPAGLYFALLMKRHEPTHDIRVIEQNEPDATYGWGVVFSDRALSFLERADAASFADIDSRLQLWHEQAIIQHGERVVIRGSTFSAIQRLALLGILQRHCRAAGVALEFGTRVTDVDALSSCDLLVGADGVNSSVRARYQEALRPAVETCSNKHVWYGTGQCFDALTLSFRENADGAFVAHAYQYSPAMSTFIVECDRETWSRAGFESMSDEESRRYCEAVFRADLDGHELQSNHSRWGNFGMVSNQCWSTGRVVLLGDALHTVHFSIGSGTRTALEDAIALFGACVRHADVPAALRAFEASRRPACEPLLDIGRLSAAWYERFREKLRRHPVAFAYDYVMRGGRLDREALRGRDPRFVAAYERIADERV